MFKTMINTVAVFGRNKLRATAIAAALACTAAAPSAALAHHRFLHVDLCVPTPEVVVADPQCDPTPQRVWIEPVYRTVTDRVWIEPVTSVQVQRFDVPAQYGVRDVVFRDYYGHARVRHEQVLISPAHCDERSVPVVVCPGHFEDQTHQVLVCEGHWETRVDQPVTVVERPHARLEIPLPF